MTPGTGRPALRATARAVRSGPIGSGRVRSGSALSDQAQDIVAVLAELVRPDPADAPE